MGIHAGNLISWLADNNPMKSKIGDRPIYLYSYKKITRTRLLEMCRKCVVRAVCIMEMKQVLPNQNTPHFGVLIYKPCEEMTDTVKCIKLFGKMKGVYKYKPKATEKGTWVDVFKIKE